MYGILFDASSKTSQYRQLLDQLRDRIADGTIPGGSKLASSRELVDRLGMARGIILEVIEQLKLEGYLQTIRGSGTFVVDGLVWNGGSRAKTPHTPNTPTAHGDEAVSSCSFAPGLPDLAFFPRRAWLSCYHDAIEYAGERELAYCPPEGMHQLREAIAAHLREIKGIRSDPEHIIIAAGASQCFSILASLFDPCKVFMEDPHAPFVRRVFTGNGARMTWIPVDEEGIVPESIPDSGAHFLYTTPNHQFPLGGTLSAARRVRLLAKARKLGCWIIEDDFDSEFRYGGKPVAPLHVMDPEQVIYVGSFSKTLSPALRLGYMIAPPSLRIRIKMAKLRWDFWNESLQQKALALFIERGHLARHLTRTHRVYRKKNALLTQHIESSMPGRWHIMGSATGMHLVLKATDEKNTDSRTIVQNLKGKGIHISCVKEYCREQHALEDALIIGYGNHSEAELNRLVDELALACKKG